MNCSAPMPPRRFDPWDDDRPDCQSLRGFAIGAVIAIAVWLMLAVAVARCGR